MVLQYFEGLAANVIKPVFEADDEVLTVALTHMKLCQILQIVVYVQL